MLLDPQDSRQPKDEKGIDPCCAILTSVGGQFTLLVRPSSRLMVGQPHPTSDQDTPSRDSLSSSSISRNLLGSGHLMIFGYGISLVIRVGRQPKHVAVSYSVLYTLSFHSWPNQRLTDFFPTCLSPAISDLPRSCHHTND